MGSRKIKRRKSGRTQKFYEKLGREPGSKDPILFNPDSLTPEPFRRDEFTAESEAAMVLAGIRPEIIYAHRKTGLIVTRESYGKFSKSALTEWEAAVEEYFGTTRESRQ